MSLNGIIKNFPNAPDNNYLQDISLSSINKIDVDNMYALLTDYHKHIQSAIENATSSISSCLPDKILIFGIGGSAMSGELLRCYLKYILKERCPQIIICRGAEIPQNIMQKDTNTMIFCCSYSGNTQETLQALKKVEQYTKNIFVCCAGGKLEQIAIESRYKLLKMPQGMMPRCAMFYAFFQLLHVVVKAFGDNILSEETYKSITNILTDKFKDSLDYSILNNKNIAIILARLMQGKIPIIYSAAERLEAVNLRWRAQIQENANQMCFGNYFPELNHNEINGWMFPKNLLDKFIVISMKDIDDAQELNDIIDKSINLLRHNNIEVIEVLVDGETLLERLVRLISIADWTSFYLAIINKVDPTSIPIISQLKA